jgi:hypothetical protein
MKTRFRYEMRHVEGKRAAVAVHEKDTECGKYEHLYLQILNLHKRIILYM